MSTPQTAHERWNALTHDEQQHLKSFIIYDDTTHIDELQKLGFVMPEEGDHRWIATTEGLACYTAGIGLAEQGRDDGITTRN